MADPITIAAIGATAGALTDKENPLRGAALGGMGGYAGATMLGGAAAGSAAAGQGAGQAALASNAPVSIAEIAGSRLPIADVGFIPELGQTMAADVGFFPGMESLAMQGGAPVITPGATSMMGNVPVDTYNIPLDMTGIRESAFLQNAGGGMGMKEYMAMNAAQGLMAGPQQQQPPSLVSTPMPRPQYQPTSTTQGLLATTKRRRSPFAQG
jgi:hypothetical protein